MPGDLLDLQWARLRSDENRGFRRGPWYRVVSTTPREAVLDVNRTRGSPPRTSLPFASTPPQTWTVGSRPPEPHGLPTGWADACAGRPIHRHAAPPQHSAP